MKAKCLHDGCSRLQRSFGLCDNHYKQYRRKGLTMPKAARKAPNGAATKYFLDHIFHTGDECLIWPFSGRRGYGQAYLNEKHVMVHREMCIRAYGEPPFPNAHAAHSCGNGAKGCFNPKHLYWATPKQNMSDRERHGTMLRGEQVGTAKLTSEQVVSIFKDQRALAVIAADHGCGKHAVHKIKRRKNWRWLTESLV